MPRTPDEEIGEGRGCPHCRSKQLAERVEHDDKRSHYKVFLKCNSCRRETLLWEGSRFEYLRRARRRSSIAARLKRLV